ncbi:MAG TPA: exodeoxyribonuclease V subunit beta [Acidobacteriota bacterium]|nr:exodeoxyribonuclease V subunit beta [Acidobacteriota bacterium]
MIPFKDFDAVNIPLEGTNLIEASAGTGKTYTISSLYLRLILENRLSVSEILVVTFTKAATEELRDRIRRKLLEGMEAFSKGHSQDEFLHALLEKYGRSVETPLRCLREALRDFDEAAIYTIHGFCQRLLFESAFETGSAFDTELITNEEDLRQEIARDFWRGHFYQAPPELVNYILSKGISPSNFFERLKAGLVHADLRVIPDMAVPEMKSLDLFREAVKKLGSTWPHEREVVGKKLMDEGLNGRIYGTTKPVPNASSGRERVVSELLANMDRLVASQNTTFPLFPRFEKLTFNVLASSTKKGHAPPEHEILHLCDEVAERAKALESDMELFILFLKGEIFRFAREELGTRKKEWNIRSFDDLVREVTRALQDQGGTNLAREVRTNYRAALIDEFQDTDPIQYAIFKTLFGTENGILFLIGDPKQAIYGFRGADLFTYLKAAAQVENRYTLRKNWRSESDLVASLNTIFSRKSHPFIYREIPYVSIVTGKKRGQACLSLEQNREPPLQLWLLEATNEAPPDAALTKTRARELIPKAVGSEILRLVQLGREKRALIGDTPLRERHIAVLVRKNRDARLVQRTLAGLKIPSVLYSSDNLFDSREAMETELVLKAISEPDNEGFVRGGLATDILGYSGEELARLMEDEGRWESVLYRFREYHEVWSSKGFISMFRYLISKENVRSRLLSFQDGERRLTNLLHLSEVLHQASLKSNPGMAGLLKWLSDQRDPDSARIDEHQLRLESDEEAVKIVTIHKSKGLEYPVVFCPFMWDGSEIGGSEITFHDENRDLQLTLDLGSSESAMHKDLAEQELLAENLRLLYVALTRAKNRCYLVWGRVSGAQTSALAYILHGPQSFENGGAAKATGSRFLSMSGRQLIKEVKDLVDEGKGAIRLSGLPAGQGEGLLGPVEQAQGLTFRRFSGTIARDWKVSSFSSLVSGVQVSTEFPDHDRLPVPPEEAEETPEVIFSFPRGARTGIFLHDLLEHLDFAEKDPALTKDLLAGKLAQYGFESQWLDTIYGMIRNVITLPLDTIPEELRLSHVPMRDRLNELEFYFPLKTLSKEKLKSVYEEHMGERLTGDFPETIERLQFAPTRGFMKGFIDLVFKWRGRFYLVDWKSNFLGNRPEAYSQKSLAVVMKEEFYVLQYCIYTIALDQYLRLRLPGYCYEKHFGGVFYIFLRGVDLERGPKFGVYRDVPPPELIRALTAQFLQHGGY